jgi:hypothetical protein
LVTVHVTTTRRSGSPIHMWINIDIYRVVREVKQSLDGWPRSIEIRETGTRGRDIITDELYMYSSRHHSLDPCQTSEFIYPRSHSNVHTIHWCSFHIKSRARGRYLYMIYTHARRTIELACGQQQKKASPKTFTSLSTVCLC